MGFAEFCRAFAPVALIMAPIMAFSDLIVERILHSHWQNISFLTFVLCSIWVVFLFILCGVCVLAGVF